VLVTSSLYLSLALFFFKSITYGCWKGGTFSITLSVDAPLLILVHALTRLILIVVIGSRSIFFFVFSTLGPVLVHTYIYFAVL